MEESKQEDITSSDNSTSRPGCIVTTEDFPLIIASVACFITFLVYGACASSLGAAIPQLSSFYGKSVSSLGLAFTTRGIGYLTGTLSSAAIIEFPSKKISKSLLVCLSIAITGLSTSALVGIKNYNVALFLFWIQGVGFGGVDTCANCVMPELWGKRVGPWMQGLHSFFGIGAVVGPSLVGGLGYKYCFLLLGLASFSPLLLMFIYAFILHNSAKNSNLNKVGNDVVNNNENSIDNQNNSRDSIIDKLNKIDSIKNNQLNKTIQSVPTFIKIFITLFFFIYVGSETGYGGWITTFALDEQLTSSQYEAAYLASYFWASLAFGRIVAIPLSIYLTTTVMLRIQLFLTIASSILFVIIGKQSYNNAVGSSVMYGYALSSIFPLAMTLVSDYGFTMDATTTTIFVVGSTCGEAIIPICIGLLIDSYGAMLLSFGVFVMSIILIILYGLTHYFSSYVYKLQTDDKNMTTGIEISNINPIYNSNV